MNLTKTCFSLICSFAASGVSASPHEDYCNVLGEMETLATEYWEKYSGHCLLADQDTLEFEMEIKPDLDTCEKVQAISDLESLVVKMKVKGDCPSATGAGGLE